MKFLFLRKKPVVKSYQTNNTAPLQASIVMDNLGGVLYTDYSSPVENIAANTSVNTIISKQTSIVSEATLVIKEKSDKADNITLNPQALKILSWLNKPNTFPFPATISNIESYFIEQVSTYGVGGMIFVFRKGGANIYDNFENIFLAQSVIITRLAYIPSYTVQINQQRNYVFNYNPQYLNYVRETENEIMILFVSGNYDIQTNQYVSPYIKAYPYALLQNQLVKFATAFHSNACFPSSVISLTYKGVVTGETILTDRDKNSFETAIRDFKLQIAQNKGVSAAGPVLIPNNPLLEVKVTPLSIPTNSTGSVEYDTWAAGKIYSYVDGGSAAAFEGKNEYSNNAVAKLQDLYDGTFRTFNTLFIDPFNIFMRRMLISMRVDPKVVDKLYMTNSVSSVRLYQKQAIAQATMITQNNGLTINEYRDRLASFSEDYADLENAVGGDVFNAQLSGNATKPAPVNNEPGSISKNAQSIM